MIQLSADPFPLLQGLGIALGIGLLIGLERGWHGRAAADGGRVAGVRTFGLLSLMGGVCALLSEHYGAWVLLGGILGVALLIAAGYWLGVKRDPAIGITTEVAALLTFVLGAAAVAGFPYVAVAAAVVTTILLGTKSLLHEGVARLSQEELYAIFKLLLIALVLLPILPDGQYGPWGALNPYVIGWLILLLAGLSFVGYFAIGLLGPQRGILWTGFFGGLLSSTALTLNFSRLGRQRRQLSDLLAIGILIASATMFPRVLVEIAVVNPGLLAALSPVLVAVTSVAYAGAFWLWWRGRQSFGAGVAPDADLGLRNPFELGSALRLGLLLVVIMVLARVLAQIWGDAGVYVLSAVSGLADVDALVLSLAKMAAQQDLSHSVATQGIVIAIVVNSLVKNLLAFAIGGVALGRQVALILLPALAVGMMVLIVSG